MVAKHQKLCSSCINYDYGTRPTGSYSAGCSYENGPFHKQGLYYYHKGRECHSKLRDGNSMASNKSLALQFDYCKIDYKNGKVTVNLSFTGDLSKSNKTLIQKDLDNAFEVVELAASKLSDTKASHAESIEV